MTIMELFKFHNRSVRTHNSIYLYNRWMCWQLGINNPKLLSVIVPFVKSLYFSTSPVISSNNYCSFNWKQSIRLSLPVSEVLIYKMYIISGYLQTKNLFYYCHNPHQHCLLPASLHLYYWPLWTKVWISHILPERSRRVTLVACEAAKRCLHFVAIIWAAYNFRVTLM